MYEEILTKKIVEFLTEVSILDNDFVPDVEKVTDIYNILTIDKELNGNHTPKEKLICKIAALINSYNIKELE